MASEIFIDTSGFYALLVRGDDQHARAAEVLREAAKRKRGLVTTDYVLDETATLLLARGYTAVLADFFKQYHMWHTKCSIHIYGNNKLQTGQH